MTRYFFDIDDGRTRTEDEFGIECADRDAIRRAARQVLPAVALDAASDASLRAVTVHVRDERGRTVLRARLSITEEWLEPEG